MTGCKCVLLTWNLKEKKKKKDEGTARMAKDFNIVIIFKAKSVIQARGKIIFHLRSSCIVLT